MEDRVLEPETSIWYRDDHHLEIEIQITRGQMLQILTRPQRTRSEVRSSRVSPYYAVLGFGAGGCTAREVHRPGVLVDTARILRLGWIGTLLLPTFVSEMRWRQDAA